MSPLTLMKRPAGYLPVAMSLAAFGLVVGHVAMFGVTHDPDEGTPAHIFQLLLAAQLPLIAFFAIKWLPRNPKSAISVLLVQFCAALIALAPVFFLHL